MILNNMKCMQRFLSSPSSKLVIEERIWDRSRIHAGLFHSFSRSARFSALMASVTAARLLPTMVDCDFSCCMHMLPCEPIASVSLSRAYSSKYIHTDNIIISYIYIYIVLTRIDSAPVLCVGT